MMNRTSRAIALLTVLLATFVAARIASAQQPPMTPAQQREMLAKNPELFLKAARSAQKWDEAAEPMKVIDRIHFVGTKGLSAWLITSPQGHVLLNTGMQASGPMIEASVRALGVNPRDIKWLLTGHAHVDHVGGHAYLRNATGARVAVAAREVALLESGGKGDFNYDGVPGFDFAPVKADRALADGDVVTVGDIALTARITPGHSVGAVTWLMNVTEGGRTYTVVFPDGSGVNPGFRISVRPSYPGIEGDYRRTLEFLASLKPDIWLHSHTETMGFEAKRARSAAEGAKAWVDPEGYAKWVGSERAKFDAIVASEQAATKRPRSGATP